MDNKKQLAQKIIRETFENSFDKSRFTVFIKNLLNRIDDAPFTYKGRYIPHAYEQYIKTLERIGKFSDGENTIDILIVMPNHFHGIINIVGAIPRNRPENITDKHSHHPGENMVSKKGENMVSPLRGGLGRFVSWFKRMTTNEYIRNVKNNGWQPFDKKLWQRNYYEHIIRNENGLNHIREYIINNPLKWNHDMENPARKTNQPDGKKMF